MLEILRTLIGFSTVSSEPNLALIEWVEQYLEKHDIPHWRVNDQGNKTSLVARIGPETGGGIVLSGHTDVVPVLGQPWESEPFVLAEREGKFYGRGTADMKSFIALALAAIPQWQQQRLAKPIWLALSHDEEIGCLGAEPMAKALIEFDAAPSLVIIGEPTDMQLVTGHKGILSYETIITGREAHSSMPEQGVNAVMLMAELMGTLNAIAETARGIRNGDSPFTTPYTTVHIGVMKGGTARNIIPRRARILWEVRPMPGEDVEALLAPFHEHVRRMEAAIQTKDPGCSIVTRAITSVRGLQMEEGAHLPLAHRIAACNHAHAVAYGTEGGFFQKHGLPVVICGPGSIDQAHQPNEFITSTQLAAGAAFMDRVADACC